MDDPSTSSRMKASADFSQARKKVFMERVLSSLAGRPTHLLSYEEVRRNLHLRERGAPRLEDIPLDKIVGSVGRYKDFTRTFLPLEEHLKERWVRVDALALGQTGFPPIEVYKVGDVYFVRDGNHRVSVARQLGSPTIQAHVTETTSRVVPDTDTTQDELAGMKEYTLFLEQTQLDRLRPQQDLKCSVPGHYHDLLEHISVHRYFMGIERDCGIPYEEAVTSWYDNVYMPLVRVIQKEAILRDFPHRTETDLYIWIIEHEYFLREQYGVEDVRDEEVAEDYAREFTEVPRRRIGRKLRGLLGTAKHYPEE